MSNSNFPLGNTVKGVVAGGAIGAIAGEIAHQAARIDIKTPENSNHKSFFRDVLDIQSANGAAIFAGVFLVTLWVVINVFFLRGTYYKAYVGENFDIGVRTLFWFNFISAGIWAAKRIYSRTKFENAVFSYIKYVTDQKQIFFDHYFERSIPELPAKALEKWNQEMERQRQLVENPHFDDKYFPDMKLLTLEEKERVYELFTNHENSYNYVTWLSTRPEEEQNKTLDQMKEQINRDKARRYDEISFKKPRRK